MYSDASDQHPFKRAQDLRVRRMSSSELRPLVDNLRWRSVFYLLHSRTTGQKAIMGSHFLGFMRRHIYEILVCSAVCLLGIWFGCTCWDKKIRTIFLTEKKPNKRTQISVIIFYSHMLHFALNVQVILSGQTQKVWVSTYSNVLYSLFIHTGEPQELSVTIYTHYSLAIWLRSFTKWVLQKKEEKKLGKQKKQHAWIQEEVFQVLACFVKIPQCSTMWPSIRKNQMSAVGCLTLQNKNKNKWTSISQARLDKFPLFQKKKW